MSKEKPTFVFSTHYSLESIITAKELGKSKSGGPSSVIDICKEFNVPPIVVDNSMSGLIELYKNCKAADMNLTFGYKVCICADINDKTPESLKSESNVIIFIKNGKEGNGYFKLIALHNKSSTEGFYGKSRLDWKSLREGFSDDLHLAIPFYSSFLAKNTLWGHEAIPDLSYTTPTVFIQRNDLPFDDILEKLSEKFPKEWPREFVQQVYYRDEASFEAFLTYMCVKNRSTLSRPNLSHMGSKNFNIARHFK